MSFKSLFLISFGLLFLFPSVCKAWWDQEGDLRLRLLTGAEKDLSVEYFIPQARLKYKGSVYLRNEFHFHTLFVGRKWL